MGRFKITALDHIVLNVGDIDRALQFYTGVLGLEGERIEQFRAIGAVADQFSTSAYNSRVVHYPCPGPEFSACSRYFGNDRVKGCREERIVSKSARHRLAQRCLIGTTLGAARTQVYESSRNPSGCRRRCEPGKQQRRQR